MYKFFFLILFGVSNMICFAQTPEIEKYYDSTWVPVIKDDAYFVAKVLTTDSGFYAKFYNTATGNIVGEGVFKDTSLGRKLGYYTYYYPDGNIKQITKSDGKGNDIFIHGFYPSGKTEAVMTYNPGTKKINSRGYDSLGNEINGYIYFRDAEFPGGATAFMEYLSKNVRSKLPVKKGAPAGKYTVMVRFTIDESGKTTNIEAETNHGFGMEEELKRVIARSPRWSNSVFKNKPAKSYRRQPLTFQIDEK